MFFDKNRIKEILLVAVAVIALPSLVLAGTIDPPESAIDSGTGEPKPTMKTLDSIPGSWDRLLPANDGPDPCHSSRFTCVMNDEAVRDNETGLVWERSPLTTEHTWEFARSQCLIRTAGGRIGWRLPSVFELASLVDPGNPGGNPDLPVGHPFINVQSSVYWSLTTKVDSDLAWAMFFTLGQVGFSDKFFTHFVWCVRGGQNDGHVY